MQSLNVDNIVASGLSKASLFRELAEEELLDLARHVHRASFASGEMVLQHMDEGDGVYVILWGNLIATLISPEGREVAFDVMTAGDYFGEIAAIDGGVRSASVSALTPSEVCTLSGARFRKLVERHPEVSGALIGDLVGRIRRLTERNYENIALRIRHRVQLELLRLANRNGVLFDGGVLSPAPTHAQIAARIGANREAVTREVSALAKKGYIRASRQSIAIVNASALIEEAGAELALDDK
jgi:CRP/FNR family transcriptional regulator, cyclic AMP receptor protein